jgi:hypothetical protein
MDHEQSATPPGRRGRAFCPNGSTRARLSRHKRRASKQLPFARAVRAGGVACKAYDDHLPRLLFRELVLCSCPERRKRPLAAVYLSKRTLSECRVVLSR